MSQILQAPTYWPRLGQELEQHVFQPLSVVPRVSQQQHKQYKFHKIFIVWDPQYSGFKCFVYSFGLIFILVLGNVINNMYYYSLFKCFFPYMNI